MSDALRVANNNTTEYISYSYTLAQQALYAPNYDDRAVAGVLLNLWAGGVQTVSPTDPLVLDLNGDGVKLTDYDSAPAFFDADNDGGNLEQTDWVSPEDGIMVRDCDGNGRIDNISETLSQDRTTVPLSFQLVLNAASL